MAILECVSNFTIIHGNLLNNHELFLSNMCIFDRMTVQQNGLLDEVREFPHFCISGVLGTPICCF